MNKRIWRNVLKLIGLDLLLVFIMLNMLWVIDLRTIGQEVSWASDNNCSNGDFELGSFECWNTGGVLYSSVQSTEKLEGSYAALLGDPGLAKCRGELPLGDTWISKRFLVPADGDPYLSFSYRILSLDELKEDKYDHFDVYIDDLSDDLPAFRILRDGSVDGKPKTGQDGCNLKIDVKEWITRTWVLSEVASFDNQNQLYDLRGKQIELSFHNISKEAPGYDSAWYNTWVYIDNVKFQKSLMMQKTSSPPGPVHEGDVITYTIAYANTGLTTQTITITDQIPFNVTLLPDTVTPTAALTGSTLSWNIPNTAPGYSGQVSFAVQVPLLPSLNQLSASSQPPPPSDSPAYVLPAAVSCDTTRFWANGVTRQPPTPNPHTIQVQIPAETAGLELALWLAVKGQVTTPPTIGGQPAQQVAASSNNFGASIWTADLTSEMLADGQITVVTHDPCQLNAVFLFDKHDPPFDLAALDDFAATSKTFTYTLDLPSVMTQTMSILLPFLDLNYWDGSQPNTALTTVTAQLDQQSQTLRANQPNLGNGLLLTQFPLTIGPHDEDVVTKTLTVQVTTEDSLYTLGPRICRPVLIENTAWLCSDKAGCISAKVANVPETFAHPGTLYLPVILKSALN